MLIDVCCVAFSPAAAAEALALATSNGGGDGMDQGTGQGQGEGGDNATHCARVDAYRVRHRDTIIR